MMSIRTVSIDEIELQSREVVRSIEAGEGSSGTGQHRPDTAMEEKIEMLKRAGAQPGAVEAAKIQKVIFLLRDHKYFTKYFEPRMASLGPIHHGNPKYELGEKFKRRLAYEFVNSCNNGNSTLDDGIIYLYGKIKKEIQQLRGCFEEEVTKNYDDEALTWMLFVDGCARLQYLFCITNYNKFEGLNIKNDSVAFVQQDLFLLENQVLYCLLKLVMRFSGKEDELRKSIESFIQNMISYQEIEQPKQEVRVPSLPTHLLDLLRTRLLGPKVGQRKTYGIWPWRKIRRENPDWQSYRNVQELKSARIQLKCSKKNSYLRNICFTRRFGFYPGYLWLPPIIVDDITGLKFMNLIAYEMCLDFENDFGISSYMSFLDSLIRDADDIKDLRKACVLHNFLGSDQEVADLFNAIGTHLVPSVEAYKDVKLQIQKYYDNSWMTWTAQLFYNRFSAPRSITSFVYSIIIMLGLTAIQAWYTVHPPPGPCDDFCKKSG